MVYYLKDDEKRKYLNRVKDLKGILDKENIEFGKKHYKNLLHQLAKEVINSKNPAFFVSTRKSKDDIKARLQEIRTSIQNIGELQKATASKKQKEPEPITTERKSSSLTDAPLPPPDFGVDPHSPSRSASNNDDTASSGIMEQPPPPFYDVETDSQDKSEAPLPPPDFGVESPPPVPEFYNEPNPDEEPPPPPPPDYDDYTSEPPNFAESMETPPPVPEFYNEPDPDEEPPPAPPPDYDDNTSMAPNFAASLENLYKQSSQNQANYPEIENQKTETAHSLAFETQKKNAQTASELAEDPLQKKDINTKALEDKEKIDASKHKL